MTENGKETFTFSSTVSRPSNLPEKTCWKDGGRHKKPSKSKKDRLRREAWVERRRTEQERVVAENPAAAPETDPAPRYAEDVTPASVAPVNGPIVPGHPGIFDHVPGHPGYCSPVPRHPGSRDTTPGPTERGTQASCPPGIDGPGPPVSMVTKFCGGGPKPFFLTPTKFVQLDGQTDTPTSSCSHEPESDPESEPEA